MSDSSRSGWSNDSHAADRYLAVSTFLLLDIGYICDLY